MATKVTATQRKHGTTALLSLYTNKSDVIRRAFDSKAENRYRSVPSQTLPNPVECLKAFMGMETTAELKVTKEEIVRGFEHHRHGYFNVNPATYVKPANQVEIDEANAYNEVIHQRRREEVDGKLALLNTAYRQACDIVLLSESGDDILGILQNFEAREF